MRIGVVNWTAREVGGAERYLTSVLPALSVRGHELAMVVEMDRPTDRDPIVRDIPIWSIEESGLLTAVEGLRRWSPDVVFTHITLDPAVEAAVQAIAPAVFFAHAYYGTCISGTKTMSVPSPRPCNRVFGAACLIHFYPRRCGGLNPLTMIRDFRKQASRQRLLPGYRQLLTNSSHMREEYIRHGIAPERIFALPMPIEGSTLAEPTAEELPGESPEARPITLLMVGRMDHLKGGAVALESLGEIRRTLGRAVRLVMIGDGPERERWTAQARGVEAREEGVRVEFTGWISRESVSRWFATADLLLVPSLWPEPFGLVGLEAGAQGLPAVAFRVGGIPDWLLDGVNGHLTTGPNHTAGTLAGAAVQALSDEEHLLALRRGAREVARRYTREEHVRLLEGQLLSAAGNPFSMKE